MIALNKTYIDKIVQDALNEDIGSGDITTIITVPANATATANFVAKATGIVAGIDIAKAAFASLDPTVVFDARLKDSSTFNSGDIIATVSGNARAILSAERVALNFLQRTCGIATLTSKYVSLVAHTKARIVDTRKTTPGLRLIEKYAVTIGGGSNHRFNLSDGILIKDNHIAAAGGVAAAVSAAKKYAPHTLKIEVEVTTINQLDEAITAGADAVLLDNMAFDMLKQAVEAASGRVTTEASGGVNEATVSAIADTGVDLISVGALTHSAPALDISLQFK